MDVTEKLNAGKKMLLMVSLILGAGIPNQICWLKTSEEQLWHQETHTSYGISPRR